MIKKCIALSILLAGSAFADIYIDVSKNQLKCNGYTITQDSKFDDLIKNCKVIDTDTDMEYNGVEKKVKFINDNSAITKCKFLNGNLKMCYLDD
jgi:hypothetical protein